MAARRRASAGTEMTPRGRGRRVPVSTPYLKNTTSAARQDLGTSRRVVLPLLDRLDRAGLTRRLVDDRREVVP